MLQGTVLSPSVLECQTDYATIRPRDTKCRVGGPRADRHLFEGRRREASSVRAVPERPERSRHPSMDRLEKGEFSAVVSLGSPSTAYRPETNRHHDELVQLFKVVRKHKVPSFNVCYSMQLFSLVHGGKVMRNPAGKGGGLPRGAPHERRKVRPVSSDTVGAHTTLQWHGDIVEELPPGAVHLAYSSKTMHQVAVLDGIHYLFQSDGQAAFPSMVRTWMKNDGEWATEGTGVDAAGLIREAVENQAYLRNTFLRLFGNFLALAIPRSSYDSVRASSSSPRIGSRDGGRSSSPRRTFPKPSSPETSRRPWTPRMNSR